VNEHFLVMEVGHRRRRILLRRGLADTALPVNGYLFPIDTLIRVVEPVQVPGYPL
jgi:hypothetical protein